MTHMMPLFNADTLYMCIGMCRRRDRKDSRSKSPADRARKSKSASPSDRKRR